MSLPAVNITVVNGALGLLPPSSEKSAILAGCSTSGSYGTLTFVGDIATAQSLLGAGELLEAAAYALLVSGGPVGVMPLSPTNAGGLSSVTHVGTGTGTVSVSSAPHLSILITLTASGALGTSTFTYKVGTGAASASQVTPTGHTFLVPGTYTVLTFPTHTYATGETYTISTTGTVTYAANGSGGSDATMTQASSPIDYYTPIITIAKAGFITNSTAQFTYSLDGTAGSTSASIVAPSAYAIPGSGVVLTFSGTFVLGDTYSFTTAAPTFSDSGDLAPALTSLETTYLSASYSMFAAIGAQSTATNWATQTAQLETAAEALESLGIFIRTFNGCPTVGSITASGGSVVVDSADTDTVLETVRTGVLAPRVAAGAGDFLLVSPITGLSQRRNAVLAAIARAASVAASENIGAVQDGAVTGCTLLYRDETSTPGLDAVGFITLRSFPGNVSSGTGLPGFFLTNGHTMDVTTSDYYPLANARVIDLACTIAKAAALPLINSKIPTTVRNGQPGVITQSAAARINARLTNALLAGLVNTSPQDAVGAIAVVDTTNNVLATSTLIINISVQPFAYASTININIGLTVSV